MGLLNIEDNRTKLIMVGGKGGVGKTTCASAIALKIAMVRRKFLSFPATQRLHCQTFLIRQLEIGKGRSTINTNCTLLKSHLRLFLNGGKKVSGPEIYEVVSSFASVDYDFVDYIGTAPGIEEEYMLNFIMELVEGRTYDVVVWDTAPAGHTLRLLKLPELFLAHMEAATKFYMNIYGHLEKMKDAVKLRESKRTFLEIIAGWEALSERIVAFIRDREAVKYLIVTIPEALGIKLTERVIGELEENRLTVENIIVNNVVKDEDCEFHEGTENDAGSLHHLSQASAQATKILCFFIVLHTK